MTLTPGLRNRVLRLERSMGNGGPLDIVGAMRRARERSLAMSPQEHEAHQREWDAACIAAVSAPDAPRGSGAELVQTLRRRRGRRLLGQSMAGAAKL